MTDTSYEKKSAADNDINSAFEGFMRGFEQFKEENDRRLSEIETRRAADPLTLEKLGRLDRMMDDLSHKSMRKRLTNDLGVHRSFPLDGCRFGGRR